MSTPLSAFVAGATGYVGRAVVRELCEKGVHVVAHVRPDSPRLAEWRTSFGELGAEVDVAPWDALAMAAALARVRPTHVFALLGTTRRRAKRDGEGYEEIDFGLTKLLLDACADLAPRPRFVYLSSIGTSRGARGAYLRARWRTEGVVRSSGLPYSIARAPLVTGPDRDEARAHERVAAAILRPALAFAARLGATALRDRYRPTDANELAYGLVHAALNYTTIDRVLQPEELRYAGANDRAYYEPKSRRDEPRH